MTQEARLHNWDPATLRDVEDTFAGAPFRWWICGGQALELHTGRSWRSHADLDIGVLRTETDEVYSWLANWDLWIAARGQLKPWQGEALEPHRGENNVWARESYESPWRFDLNIGSGDDGWIYRRDQETRRSWDAAVLRTSDGIPYLAPELQLLFKSKNPRPKDHLDAQQVIPLLDAGRSAFLADHLHDDHPWRHQMAAELRLRRERVRLASHHNYDMWLSDRRFTQEAPLAVRNAMAPCPTNQ